MPYLLPRLPRLILLAAILVKTTACAHLTPTEAIDLLVLGHVETFNSEGWDEWGLNGEFSGRLRVTRVLRGVPPSSLLPIRYIAHDSYASDRELELHLQRAGDGTWHVCSDGRGRGYICH